MTEPTKHLTADDLRDTVIAIGDFTAASSEILTSAVLGELTHDELAEYVRAEDAAIDTVERLASLVAADPDTNPMVALITNILLTSIAADREKLEGTTDAWIARILDRQEARNK